MRSKLINRILSWVVAAVLAVGLLPVLSTLALAAEDDEITAIRTTTLAPTAGTSSANADEGWDWNGTTKTLTLTNAYIAAVSGDGITLPADATIVLVGNNIVRGADVASGGSSGIYSTGAVIITGSGSLITIGGTAPIQSYGIFCNSVTVNSGTINAIGGTANYSRGIVANSTDFTQNGGTVTATGGTSTGSGNNSYGIVANTTINLKGGVLIARSGTATTSNAFNRSPGLTGVVLVTGGQTANYAVYASTGTFKTPRTATLDLTSQATADHIATYGWGWNSTTKTLTLNGLCVNASSGNGISLPAGATIVLDGVNVVRTATGLHGIHGLAAIDISGSGNLTAIGGNINNSSFGIYADANLIVNSGHVTGIGGTTTGTYNGSYGLYTRVGIIKISGGYVTGIGGTSVSAGSYGMISQQNVDITGGTVVAIGGTATDSSGIRSNGTFTMSGGKVRLYGNTKTLYIGSAGDVTPTFTNNVSFIDGSQAGKAAVLGIIAYAVALHGTGGTGTALTSYPYGTGAVLPSDWTKPGCIFGGWYDNAEFSGDSITEITSTDEGNKEYWAKWTKITKVIEVTDDTANDSIAVTADAGNLDEVFDRVVTQADVAGDNVVKLSLNVSDITTQTSEVEAIKAAADKGSEVYFFDVTLTKTVDDGVNTPQPTTLTNIPIPVEVHIKLTGDLAGKAYYKVYRYHDSKAEQISNDPSKQEHYRVDVANSEIIIYTMKFSTYAIFGNDDVLALNTGYDVDVQAKITADGSAVYKIDIAWGAMTFEYRTGNAWNPDTHSYDGGAINGWLIEGFDGENNKISTYNHSNGDVEVTFTVTENSLSDVDMTVNQTNSYHGAEAQSILLGKVPNEGASAESINAYLWLDGEPSDIGQLSATYTKAAVVTVTIKAAGGDVTPQNP